MGQFGVLDADLGGSWAGQNCWLSLICATRVYILALLWLDHPMWTSPVLMCLGPAHLHLTPLGCLGKEWGLLSQAHRLAHLRPLYEGQLYCAAKRRYRAYSPVCYRQWGGRTTSLNFMTPGSALPITRDGEMDHLSPTTQTTSQQGSTVPHIQASTVSQYVHLKWVYRP